LFKFLVRLRPFSSLGSPKNLFKFLAIPDLFEPRVSQKLLQVLVLTVLVSSLLPTKACLNSWLHPTSLRVSCTPKPAPALWSSCHLSYLEAPRSSSNSLVKPPWSSLMLNRTWSSSWLDCPGSNPESANICSSSWLDFTLFTSLKSTNACSRSWGRLALGGFFLPAGKTALQGFTPAREKMLNG
jgi:hypothetical protein